MRCRERYQIWDEGGIWCVVYRIEAFQLYGWGVWVYMVTDLRERDTRILCMYVFIYYVEKRSTNSRLVSHLFFCDVEFSLALSPPIHSSPNPTQPTNH